MANNCIIGVLSNSVGVSVLLGIAYATHLLPFAVAALAVNYFVYLVHALPFNSEKFFDATGSCTYLVLAVGALVKVGLEIGFRSPRQIVNPVLVMVWCIRLGSYLLARIMRDGKDSRFDEFKKNWLRFLGVWTIQADWCFLVACPALVAATCEACTNTVLGALDIAGWCVWGMAFAIEVIADRQKDAFRRNPENKGKFITSGLWAYSRHPNYFGEICMWIGICLSGSSCFQGATWVAWISPVTTCFLLLKVSGVPMLEKKGEETWGEWPEYKWYMQHTPCIVPALRRPPAFSAESYKKIDS